MDAAAPDPPHEPLPARLKRETQALHTRAERAGAMGELLAGRLARAAYVRLLRELLTIYEALEGAVSAQPADAPARRLWQPVFARSVALCSDLLALAPAAAAHEPPLPPTAAYAQRLRAFRPGEVRLVAHLYTRCLGDLHGGQLLLQRVSSMFGLHTEAGTRFYRLGTAPQLQLLRDGLRRGLASLELNAADADAVVAEACWSFEQHERVFEAIPRCRS